MIQRTFFAKLRDEVVGERTSIAATLREQWSLDAAFDVGIPSDEHSNKAWDLFLRIEATSPEHLEIILSSEVYTEWIATWLQDRSVVTKAWNFHVM